MVNSVKKSLKKAFTITELVIVIAVIAILAAVLIPTFSNVVSNANQSAAMQNCRNAITDYGEASNGLVISEGDEKIDNDYFYLYMNSGIHLISKGTDSLTASNTTLSAGTTKTISLTFSSAIQGASDYSSSDAAAAVSNWALQKHQIAVEYIFESDATIYMADPVEINSSYYVSVFLYQTITGDEDDNDDGVTNFYSTAYIYTGTYFSLTEEQYESAVALKGSDATSLSGSDFALTVS